MSCTEKDRQATIGRDTKIRADVAGSCAVLLIALCGVYFSIQARLNDLSSRDFTRQEMQFYIDTLREVNRDTGITIPPLPQPPKQPYSANNDYSPVAVANRKSEGEP
jgi:hypothetical protein